MKLDKENTRQILKIVIIAIIVLVALINIEPVWNVVKTTLSILSPFIWGLAIAFILNIFMTLYENKLFRLGKKNKRGTARQDNKTKVAIKENESLKGNIAENKVSEHEILKSNISKRKKKSKVERAFSITLSIITIIAVVTVILILIIPQLVEIITNFISNIPSYLLWLREFAINTTEQFPEINDFIQSITIDTAALRSGIMSISKDVLDVTINQISGLFSGVVDFIIAVIFAVYILANKEALKLQSKKFVYARLNKDKADSFIKICRLARDSFRNFLTGQAKEAVILGVLCALGMLILGIPYAGPIGALTALTAFIPIVGAFIGGFIGAVLIVAVDPIKALIFIIFIIALQQIEGNLIYPHVVGKNIGLPSIWVLVAITVGGSLFGIMGMIVGLPIVSIIYAIITENTNRRLKEKNLEKEFES